MISGRIFNVQRFSIHDGPGVRTTVFLKGCPGRCFWCHNPESQSPAREVIRLAGRCIGCGACSEVCPLAADGRVSERVPPECRVCGACVGSCPTGARQVLGRDVSVGELLAEVLRDRPFFEESDGGITFSGGEPLRQPAFLISALEACKDAGLHTALDTCGYGCREDLLAAAELSDVVLFDLKHSEPRRHFEATGLPLEPILDNLRALCSLHGHVWLRLPIVPGFNDGHDDVERAAELRGRAALGSTGQPPPLSPRRNSQAPSCRPRPRRLGATATGASVRDPCRVRRTRAPHPSRRLRMNDRTRRLRQESLDARPSVSAERALLVTRFYREHEGKLSAPVLRGASFRDLCEKKAVFIGPGELIVGERGPRPKAVPTFPELTCHSLEDLRILATRPLTSYEVPADVFEVYEREIIPYWRGRSLRDRIFEALPERWKEAYASGLFTEFMEQRAPGHTVLDDKIYRRGLLDFAADIRASLAAIDDVRDPEAWDKREELRGMRAGDRGRDPIRRAPRRGRGGARGLGGRRGAPRGASPHRRGLPPRAGARPARPPRGAAELLVLSPRRDHRAERLGLVQPRPPRPAPAAVLRARARRRDAHARGCPRARRVLLRQVQQPPRAPQGRRDRGRERHLHRLREHQPRRARRGWPGRSQRPDAPPARRRSTRCTCSSRAATSSSRARPRTPSCTTPCASSARATAFPSLFNADAVVEEQLRQGKSLEDARAGGCSGCVEVGAFGKEAYILTGYFNLPKILELALHDGRDPRTGKQIGPSSGRARARRVVRGRAASVRDAARPRPRDQDRGQPDDRAHVRAPDARAVPLRPDRRLREKRPGLQRRRGALQQRLHPGRGDRDRDRQPGGAPRGGVRGTKALPRHAARGAGRATSRRTSRSASGS